jgi:hypothetical protein
VQTVFIIEDEKSTNKGGVRYEEMGIGSGMYVNDPDND